MQKRISLLVASMAVMTQAHASTLGNINGVSGWAKFISLLMIPNIAVFMLALPFFLASRMKMAGVKTIAASILFLEALAAGICYLILYFLFS
jgi:hypothetical protein